MIIITILTLIVAISLQNKQTSISPILFARLASIFLIYSAFLSLNVLYIQTLGSGIGIYSGFYQVTTISQSIEIFIYITGAFILMPWYPYIEDNTVAGRELIKSIMPKFHSPLLSEYSLIILFTTLGGSLLISSSDLVSMYLSIELQSFAVYLLATIYRDSESSTSAGLKYFLLGGLSSCFILLGAGLLYSYTGLTNLESIYSLISVPSSYVSGFSISDFSFNTLGATHSSLGDSVISSSIGSGGYLLGLTLIIVGFLFKIAAAPFHNWAPDVYDGVPTIVTTWLTIMPKISIVIFLLELVVGLGINIDATSINLGDAVPSFNVLKNLFLISSLLSLIIGTVVGLAQYKIKRLLAYSTISHVGFLLLCLAINSEQSVESLIFYILQYSITNLNTFLILLVFGYTLNSYVARTGKNSKSLSVSLPASLRTGGGGGVIPPHSNSKSNLDINFISELKGQFISNPLLSLSFAICLFSMAGIPPLIGFFAKQQVLYSATSSGYYFLSIVAILVSVISASYYLQIIKVIHFPASGTSISTGVLSSAGEKEGGVGYPTPANSVYITNIHSMTISTLTLTILLFIINPSLLLNSTHLLALSIFNS